MIWPIMASERRRVTAEYRVQGAECDGESCDLGTLKPWNRAAWLVLISKVQRFEGSKVRFLVPPPDLAVVDAGAGGEAHLEHDLAHGQAHGTGRPMLALIGGQPEKIGAEDVDQVLGGRNAEIERPAAL